MGIALSLWEVFTLFETLNIKNAKMYFEPQRYHQLMFGNFYKFIKNEEYNYRQISQIMWPQIFIRMLHSAATKNRDR